VQQGADDTDDQQWAGFSESVAEGVESSVEEYPGQSHGEQAQVGARFLFDARVDPREREQRLGVEQDLYAGDGQQQRQPEGLLQRAGDLLLAALTVMTRGDTPSHESHDRFPLPLTLLPRGETGVS
jgi:hypothetical protein